MTCPVCNKKNKNGVSVCAHCGAKLFVESVSEEESRNMVGKYKMSISKKFLIGALSASAVVIIVLLIFLLSPSKTETRPSGEIIYSNSQNASQAENSGRNSAGVITENTRQPESANVVQGTTSVPQTGGANTAEVIDYRLRMRSQPTTRSQIVEHLPKGAIVTILAKSNLTTIRMGGKNVSDYWYRVKWEKPSENNQVTIVTGWVWGKFLKLNSSNG